MVGLDRCGRPLAGIAWFAAWSGLIYLSTLPWRDLGGLVPEWLLWAERFSLYACLALGFGFGGLVSPATRGRVLRWLLYPPALGVALGMLLLQAAGWYDATGILLTGLLSYVAAVTTVALELSRFSRGADVERSEGDRAEKRDRRIIFRKLTDR